MTKPKPLWHPGEDETLRRLWGERTAKYIADELVSLGYARRTRNAIVGRAHRMGLAAKPTPIKPVVKKIKSAHHKAAYSNGVSGPPIGITIDHRMRVKDVPSTDCINPLCRNRAIPKFPACYECGSVYASAKRNGAAISPDVQKYCR